MRIEIIVSLFNSRGDQTASWKFSSPSLEAAFKFVAAVSENRAAGDVRLTVDIALPPS